jgi:putative transposase
MSRTASPSAGRPYGLARVCRLWRTARATVYRHRAPPRAEPPRRPGPVGAMPDAALLDAIRGVLAASPFHGEGHRKVLCGRPGFDNRLLSLAASSPGMTQGEPLHAPWP